MKKFALALDLKDDPELIEEYIKHHQNVWPEIKQSILDSGIQNMEIYQVETRLFMLMETTESFSFERKSEMDRHNPKVQEWEALMDAYQERLPFAKPEEKWVLMNKIFEL